jgi:hypothetical protein
MKKSGLILFYILFASAISLCEAVANEFNLNDFGKKPYLILIVDEWEIRYCLAKYNREVEKSKQLIAKNGSMTEFFYAQRNLRRKFFELTPDRMVYDQKFIDLWEAFDIGEIDFDFASKLTMKIYNDGYNNQYENIKKCR